MPAVDLNHPLAPPPLGAVPDFKHPQNEAILAYLTLAVALSSVTLFAWFRFLVKIWIVRTLHVEDYFIPFAWIFAVGHIVCGFMINGFAPIIHSWEMTMHTFGTYLLWYRIGSICYNISIVLIKISMLVQVLRIFVPRGAQSKTYWICHALIWINSLYYFISVFLMIFSCRPLSKAWQPWIEGKCIEIGAVAMTTAAVNLVGDLSILFLTQVKIWNLMRVERKQRIKLSIVFFAALIPCGFAIMCLYYNGKQLNSADFPHDSAYMSIACYGEIASGMFVLFLPMLPRFFTHIKEVTTTFTSTARGKPPKIGLAFSDVGADDRNSGAGREVQRKKSLWHISYTERGSDEDRRPIVPRGQGGVATHRSERSIVVKTDISIFSKETR
ncbi:hypothetical protein P280DRAFT_546572 [Massarina eburnea CBS 473.64]|uniref:Rhodopsin domain-containing protein n=1 Tax=Massarina eburnea CBS 473.64 TaxID=1395130 RepID=A0A6A6S9T2_9PLEO|nr:hypothetical protein P280DRAFT_546572 [Massarina eburnea CBS 473.64]